MDKSYLLDGKLQLAQLRRQKSKLLWERSAEIQRRWGELLEALKGAGVPAELLDSLGRVAPPDFSLHDTARAVALPLDAERKLLATVCRQDDGWHLGDMGTPPGAGRSYLFAADYRGEHIAYGDCPLALCAVLCERPAPRDEDPPIRIPTEAEADLIRRLWAWREQPTAALAGVQAGTLVEALKRLIAQEMGRCCHAHSSPPDDGDPGDPGDECDDIAF